MRLTELLRCSEHLRLATGSPSDVEISEIQFDSRLVEPGTLFVALIGARADGHDYVERALAQGASAILVDARSSWAEAELAVPVCVADDTRVRLGSLAATFYGHPADALNVVGITGTNGKTTVTFLLESVLTHAGHAPGVLGTVNYRWPGHVEPAANTTPESLVVQRLLRRMHTDGVRTVAMEVSSHGLATNRLRGTKFDVAVFTNFTQDHLDFHGSMAEYRDAKAALFSELLPASGPNKAPVAVINADDPEAAYFIEVVRGARTLTYSAAGGDADWRATRWEQDIRGTRMEVSHPGGRLEIQTRLLGEFNVSNVLATLAAAVSVGVEPAVAAEALRNLRGVPGRLQHFGGGGKPHVFVDYAHTPDALRRALDALRPLATARLVALFGCGGDRDRDKRPKMGRAAADVADHVMVTSDNPRTEDPQRIVDDVRAAFTPDDSWSAVIDRRAAIRETIAAAGADDVILIAGKGHETYQEVHGVRRPFDDAAVVTEALR